MTAGGKNVAPAVLEDRVRAHALVSQCLVVGDGQPFIAALVTIDPEAFPDWASAHGKSGDVADLVDDPDLRAEIAARGRRRQRGGVPGGVDPQVRDPPRRLDRGGRPAHAQPQAQAQRRGARVQGRDRRAVRLSAPPDAASDPAEPRAGFLCHSATRARVSPIPSVSRVSGPDRASSAPRSSGPSRLPARHPDGRQVSERKVTARMDRRRLLLILAVFVAVIGTALVFLYVQGRRQAARRTRSPTSRVLKATQDIAAGETYDAALAAGKISLQPVPAERRSTRTRATRPTTTR